MTRLWVALSLALDLASNMNSISTSIATSISTSLIQNSSLGCKPLAHGTLAAEERRFLEENCCAYLHMMGRRLPFAMAGEGLLPCADGDVHISYCSMNVDEGAAGEAKPSAGLICETGEPASIP